MLKNKKNPHTVKIYIKKTKRFMKQPTPHLTNIVRGRPEAYSRFIGKFAGKNIYLNCLDYSSESNVKKEKIEYKR